MDLSNFLKLNQEASLLIVFIALLIYDIFTADAGRRHFRLVACLLMAAHTVAGFFMPATGAAFGGMYASTDMTVLMKNILNVATLFIFMQSSQWLISDDSRRLREGEFYTITLATLFGMYIMISANHFMLLYIGLETASLPLACLCAYNKYDGKSAEAGAKFILTTALSSGVMMFGLSYLYGATGTLYFEDISRVLTADAMTVMGFTFFFAGLAYKISLVPFHLWTADVYEGAPTGVTAYLSVVSKASASFVLIFTLYHVFGNIEAVWHYILWGITVITIIIGNLFAIRQKDMKRFFAFSSISQAGYILMGIMSGAGQGATATVYYILIYLFSNLAAFGVIASVENHSGKTGIDDYNGLFKTNPRLALIMMLSVFSLAGIPPFAGFFSKFFIFAATAAQGDYVLVLIALLNTIISLYYYLLIVKAMFIKPAGESPIGCIRTDNYNALSLACCTAGILLAGIISGIYSYINLLAV